MTFKNDQTLGESLAVLSDVISSRRTMLRKGVTLGLAASMGAPALRTRAQDDHDDDEHAHEEASTPAASDDHTESDDHGAANGQHTETPVPTGPVQPFELYDPVLPSVASGTKDITMVARDVTRLIAPDVPFAGWSYDGTIPGRPLRVVEGDTVNVTFRVDSSANAHHSLDFHAAKTAPDVSFGTINAGEELTWSFVPRHPGAFMYHCGTPEILMHVGAGMYGAIIVDPKEGWSPAHELILVQSDVYLAPGPDGISVPDYDRMLGAKDMDFVVFNGYANQYVEHPIVVPVSEPIRIFVVNVGPNVWSSFHVVGTIFDRAYINGSPKNQLFDLQSITIGPGDSACVEFTLDEPGTYPAVNHAFGHAAHGAVALLQAQ
jgi:nitrite reductase (NO-forming)